ncbi:MAG: helix-turn-helix domain-containing protein [Thermotogae bacterium]|nr:helix-turn-helix domain-containing protein [Thermotogota bacterium]
MKKLEILRRSKGLPRWKVAKETGIATITLFNVEKGKCYPNLKTAISLSKFFGVPIDDLFEVKGGEER